MSNALTQQLNDLLYNRCIEHRYNFIDNGAVSKVDLWTDGVHLLDSGKTKIANKSLFLKNNLFAIFVLPLSRR